MDRGREEEAGADSLSAHEQLLVSHYRRCTADRQDVALYFLQELADQSRPPPRQNFQPNVVPLRRK